MDTPGATALYLARKPWIAIGISVVISLVATWTGLFFSFYTPYPVSFYITGEAFAFYLFVRYVCARFTREEVSKGTIPEPSTDRGG
jgi:zinc/manganese transport system permease protein